MTTESSDSISATLSHLLQADVSRVSLLRARPGHDVYALCINGRRSVLKLFHQPTGNLELEVYQLLRRYDVPTLPATAIAGRALLLEDLDQSHAWRLAEEVDAGRPEVGVALARWYRRLHQAGRRALADGAVRQTGIAGWVDLISERSLMAAGNRFRLAEAAVWPLVLAQFEPLKRAFKALPWTFNYNDFAIENLALSRTETPLRAIVFDYDQFSLGPIYSDWRNVTYSLHGDGRSAFASAYGPVDELEKVLDDPLSVLHGLVIASGRRSLPGWAKPLIDTVMNGELEQQIIRAMPRTRPP